MRLTRTLTVLLLLMTAVTPSLAAVCASVSSMHNAMAPMVDHNGAVTEIPCYAPAPAPDHLAPSDHAACHTAAICHLASGGALAAPLPAIAVLPAAQPLSFGPFGFASVALPPPIKPPIA